MAADTPEQMSSGKAEVAADDARVFDALEQAQKQYDEYIKISRAVSVADAWTDALILPPADVPLSLTIWPTR